MAPLKSTSLIPLTTCSCYAGLSIYRSIFVPILMSHDWKNEAPNTSGWNELWEVSGRDPAWGRPRTCSRDYILKTPWGFHREAGGSSREREVWASLLWLLRSWPGLRWAEDDGWVGRCLFSSFILCKQHNLFLNYQLPIQESQGESIRLIKIRR